MIFLRPVFWTLLTVGLLWLPILAATMLEVNYHDPAHCTLDAATCDKLRQ